MLVPTIDGGHYADISQITSRFVEIVPEISQIAFKFMAIILKLRRRCNGLPSAATRWPEFGDWRSSGRPLAQIFRHSDTPLLPIPHGRRFPRPTPERVFAVDHRSGSGFSGIIPSAPPSLAGIRVLTNANMPPPAKSADYSGSALDHGHGRA